MRRCGGKGVLQGKSSSSVGKVLGGIGVPLTPATKAEQISEPLRRVSPATSTARLENGHVPTIVGREGKDIGERGGGAFDQVTGCSRDWCVLTFRHTAFILVHLRPASSIHSRLTICRSTRILSCLGPQVRRQIRLLILRKSLMRRW